MIAFFFAWFSENARVRKIKWPCSGSRLDGCSGLKWSGAEWRGVEGSGSSERGLMVNAAYRSFKSELLPTTAWRKEDIKQWLLAKNIPFPDDSLKCELLQTVASVRSEYTSCVVDEMAEQRAVTVCRLPPYHCELNPLELVWSQIKRQVVVRITIQGVFHEQFNRQCIRCSFGQSVG
jgi:transposase